MRTLSWFISFVVIAIVLVENAKADCDRNFYNNSDVYFGIVMPHPHNCILVAGSQVRRTGCIIVPHSSVLLHYDNDAPRTIAVTSNYGGFILDIAPFTDCHISPGGNTGAFAVNEDQQGDPVDGDINTCGLSNWPCPPVGRSRRKLHLR